MRTSRGPRNGENADTAAFGGLVLSGNCGRGILIGLPAGVPALALLADGMGGHLAGATASRLVIDQLVCDDRLLTGGYEAITEAVVEAHDAIYAAMGRDAALAGMGTTIVGVVVPPAGKAKVFNVGDSRLLVRDAEVGLVQYSVDDADREATGTGSVLTQCLGGTTERVRIAPHTADLEVRDGDRLLLCSDGLSDVLGQDQIAVEIRRPGHAAAVADRLVESARIAGAEDDVTVVVVDVREAA